MLPDSPEERANRYRDAGLVVVSLAVLWFVVLRGAGADPREAGLWYGAALLLAGTLVGYGLGFEHGSAE